jgi:hypothetical protein
LYIVLGIELNVRHHQNKSLSSFSLILPNAASPRSAGSRVRTL